MTTSEAPAFRIVGGSQVEFQPHVLKTPLFSDAQPGLYLLTGDLLDTIARYNEALSPAEVHAALLAGKSVYTSFSRYTLAP